MPGTTRPMLAWLERAPADRGIHFAAGDEDWEFWSYHRLAGLTRQVARGLVRVGVRRNDVVTVVEPVGPRLVAAFFGAMLAGATPSPVAPPLVFQDPDAYLDHVSCLLTASRSSLVLTGAEGVAEVERAAAGIGVPAELIDKVLSAGADGGAPQREPADLALVQFTSGSSGRSRGVRMPFEALEANAHAIRTWLEATESDAWGSWLPVHHDMGLIGCLISPVIGGNDVWLLRPEHFIHRPVRYLECFGRHGATITAIPNFGLDFIVRRVKPEQLAGLDFSGWKNVVLGAERIDAGTLERFHRLLAPRGFQRRFLRPAYGLAEVGLAATGLPMDEEWAGVAVEPGSLSVGREIESSAGGTPQVVVGCGRPVPGMALEIVSEADAVLPERHVGEVVLRGSSVAAGYVDEAGTPSLTRLAGGTLYTGDAGFLADGQLFVLGRLGDSMKARGRTIFAEHVEAGLLERGVPGSRVAVLLGSHQGLPTVVVVLEDPKDDWLASTRQLLRERTPDARPVVLPVPRGTIARTSSAKPKRRQLWRNFIEGELPGVPAAAAPSAT